MIQGVIFDYGNVLSRTLDLQPRAAWEHKLGLEPGGLERRVHNDSTWIEVQCGRMAVEAHWRDVGTALGLTSADTQAMRADFYRGDVRNDALVSRMDELRAAGLRVGILSNFSTELRTLMCRQDLLAHVDDVVISAEIGFMKPAPSAYQAVLNRLNLSAARSVFVDDLAINVEAAQALGFHGIIFRNNPSCLAELDACIAAPGRPR
jgi:putative hydrolase of the HAD superfamily